MSGNNNFKRWVTAVSKQSGDREKKKFNNILPLPEVFIFQTSVWPLYDKQKQNKQKTPTLELEAGFVSCRKDDGSL